MTLDTRISRRTFGRLAAAGAAAAVIGTPAILRAQTAITFAVPNPSALTWMPYWVAVGEGYFAEEGRTPTLEAIDGSSAVLQAMSLISNAPPVQVRVASTTRSSSCSIAGRTETVRRMAGGRPLRRARDRKGIQVCQLFRDMGVTPSNKKPG